MVTLLITSILALGLIAIAIYFWQKPAKTTEPVELPPPPQMTSLFAAEETKQLASVVQEPLLQPQAQTDQVGADQPFTEELIRSWRESPDRVSTTRLLHAAALSDDAETYRKAVELVLRVWHEKGISEISAAELQTLFNSEFWLLSSGTRNSGAGFVLKQTLSRAKRELERANNPT